MLRGQSGLACDTYEEWISENPDDWNTTLHLAGLHTRLKRADDAIRHYRRAGWRFLNDPNENPRKAAAMYLAILRLDPGDEDARKGQVSSFLSNLRMVPRVRV